LYENRTFGEEFTNKRTDVTKYFPLISEVRHHLSNEYQNRRQGNTLLHVEVGTWFQYMLHPRVLCNMKAASSF